MKMPTIAAYSYKHYIGQPFIYPRNDLGYAENFLNMCFGEVPDDVIVVSLMKGLEKRTPLLPLIHI